MWVAGLTSFAVAGPFFITKALEVQTSGIVPNSDGGIEGAGGGRNKRLEIPGVNMK